LKGANLRIYAGETLALIGDNGAGKTTLVRVLGGELKPTGGKILLNGREVVLNGVREAHVEGIHIVYQDLALAPDLTAPENMVLGHEPVLGGFLGKLGFLDRKAARELTADRLGRLRIDLGNLDEEVRHLSGGQRQSLAVARGMTFGHRCMLLDEPTAALGPAQTEMVYKAIAGAAAAGVAVVVVSHDLPQVLEFADRVAIMRQGRIVTVEPSSALDVRRMIHIMMGDDVDGLTRDDIGDAAIGHVE